MAVISEALRVAICEDNAMDMKKAYEAIHCSGFPVIISAFSTGTDILKGFVKGLYHVIFLDIFLPSISGIDIAHDIRERDSQVIIVFLTSSSDYTREGYRLGALKYIEKPFEPEAVKAALELAWRLRQSKQTCTVVTKWGMREVALRDIHYVEVINHTCHLHLDEGLIKTSMSIGQMALLLSSAQFVRCHRSFIVNLLHVRAVERDFIMTSGERVYIRGKDQKKMAELFARYLAAETRRLGDGG